MSIGTTHRPLRSIVLDELRRLVITGELTPGTRLVEDRLAEQLGVSRNPVREALQTLATEGFVTVTPRRGAVVSRVTPEHAEELFDVRTALEPLAARTAARRAGPADLARLRQVLDEAREATGTGELDRLAALNTAFHQAVVDASGNEYLALLLAPMERRVQWVFRAGAGRRGLDSWAEHEELLQAIAAHDEDAAAAVAAAHVAAARASYLALDPPVPDEDDALL